MTCSVNNRFQDNIIKGFKFVLYRPKTLKIKLSNYGTRNIPLTKKELYCQLNLKRSLVWKWAQVVDFAET